MPKPPIIHIPHYDAQFDPEHRFPMSKYTRVFELIVDRALAAVERADMQEYVRTYLHGQPLATVLLSSAEAIASGEWTPERLTALAEEVAP